MTEIFFHFHRTGVFFNRELITKKITTTGCVGGIRSVSSIHPDFIELPSMPLGFSKTLPNTQVPHRVRASKNPTSHQVTSKITSNMTMSCRSLFFFHVFSTMINHHQWVGSTSCRRVTSNHRGCPKPERLTKPGVQGVFSHTYLHPNH